MYFRNKYNLKQCINDEYNIGIDYIRKVVSHSRISTSDNR